MLSTADRFFRSDNRDTMIVKLAMTRKRGY